MSTQEIADEGVLSMTHEMQLQPEPFELIKNGTKTYELRLYDEKRRLIKGGDKIIFTDTCSGERMEVLVLELCIFDSFKTLYEELPLSECGYTAENIDTASPDDMDLYYSKEKQSRYGVVGIKISRCNQP